MTTFENDFKQRHQYPVYSQDNLLEGAVKRYTSIPTYTEIFEYAFMGLPKVFPMTNQQVSPEFAISYLDSAMSEIEIGTSINLTETTHALPVDDIDAMFSSNFTGIKLSRFPATEIVSVTYVFPHAMTNAKYQTYTIPPEWIMLRRNKMNVVASIGSITVTADSPGVLTAGGLFSAVTGMNRGSWQPGTIEVKYKAGFPENRLPTLVADLVKTWASHRLLEDVVGPLFPSGSVSVGIDSVSQNVSYAIQQQMAAKLESLEKKKDQLKKSVEKGFGRTTKIAFIGA